MGSDPDKQDVAMVNVHEQFNDPSTDVSFKSTDGVVFQIHRANLSVAGGAFPADLIPSPMKDEYVNLTETAATLEWLFRFVYPRLHSTDLGAVKFDALALLAEAAQKYEVFAAMDACLVRMSDQVGSHPIEVLNYAAKHGYTDLADKAAFFTVDQPLDKIIDTLSPNLLTPWLRYYSKWTSFPASYFEGSVVPWYFANWIAGGVVCPHFSGVVGNLNIPECVKHITMALMLKKTFSSPCGPNCEAVWKQITIHFRAMVTYHAPHFGSVA